MSLINKGDIIMVMYQSVSTGNKSLRIAEVAEVKPRNIIVRDFGRDGEYRSYTKTGIKGIWSILTSPYVATLVRANVP